MAGFARFLKTTVIGGILVLLPLVACAAAIAAVVSVLHDLLVPIARLLPVERLGGIRVASLLVVAAVLLLCFVLGLLVRTAVARAVGRWFDRNLLGHLPGYRLVRRLAGTLGGDPSETLGRPVWVRLGDSREIGFLTEEHVGDEVAVFLPASPRVTVGRVVVVPRSRTERISAPLPQVVKSISDFGVGSSTLGSPR
jgi:uncharacterized membrane protein